MKQYTINEMKEKNIRAKQHWFDKGAMAFFNTEIEEEPNVLNVFITSERMELNMPKKYALRWFNDKNAHVETIGNMQQFETLEEAKEMRKIITKALKSAQNREWDIMENISSADFEESNIKITGCYTLPNEFEYKFFRIKMSNSEIYC